MLVLLAAGNAADVERRLDALDTCLETIKHDIKQIKLNLQEVKEREDSSKGNEDEVAKEADAIREVSLKSLVEMREELQNVVDKMPALFVETFGKFKTEISETVRSQTQELTSANKTVSSSPPEKTLKLDGKEREHVVTSPLQQKITSFLPVVKRSSGGAQKRSSPRSRCCTRSLSYKCRQRSSAELSKNHQDDSTKKQPTA
ncbi:hypothetical protein KFL_000030120 [Klebsormidium nitens]|uniref:Uncharacterized protein n=1 Tax=Klebsormidium nitens TaxID=105231 RepID=A0A1Y1HIP1_KLENI|nr:hypothetical protein KFL_000030120 [Klebsormidium nitens]|eukprot:GAQ77733.1 hypothetical protein KFL_000030120 [Klebsormidium nitens]